MSDRIRAQYDSLYASQEVFFGGGEPLEVVRRLKDYINVGNVLDIGGGEGRNALYLAKQGFAVAVYDISGVGLEKLKVSAKEKSLDIETKVTDVVVEGISGQYDVVVLSFVLHHIDEKDAIKLIKNSQNHTNINGVHVLMTFSSQGALYERNKNSTRFYPSADTIKDLYKDWDIKELTKEEITTLAKDKQGQRLKNHVATLIAVKKG